MIATHAMEEVTLQAEKSLESHSVETFPSGWAAEEWCFTGKQKARIHQELPKDP